MPSNKSVSDLILKKEPSQSACRRRLHKFVPLHFNNVLGLFRRLVSEGNPAGRIAILYSVMGLLLTPLDIFLQFFERRLYQNAKQGKLLQIFVCGAPRSGTTVAGQSLIKYLPVFYLSNLTSLFPRSPIMAKKLFGWMLMTDQKELPLSNFYGRTTRLSYPNDALYIWDRWTGTDRKKIPDAFGPDIQRDLTQFFNAIEEYSGKPFLNKNNSLNTYAYLVSQVLPKAYFICMDRDPLYLAQSHYLARKFIHGDEHIPYGIRGDISETENAVEDICRQVLFHKKSIQEQQKLIGSDRFIILPYEDFCARPAHWVREISEQILGQKLDDAKLEEKIPPLIAANNRKIDEATFRKIEKAIIQLTNSIN